MPRTSATELLLSKRVLRYLSEREQTKKTYSILQRLINSLLKARSSHRRKEYRDRLNIILQNLSVQSEDLQIEKEKYKTLLKKYTYIQQKHSKYVNSVQTKENQPKK